MASAKAMLVLLVPVCYAPDMPNNEALQFDMFSGEAVDNRTTTQKRKAKKREAPQQFEMFSQRDVAQFEVRARPQMPLPESATMALIIQDPRSPEQVELDRQRAAEALNGHLFSEPEPEQQLAQAPGPECPWARPSTRNTPYLVDLLIAPAW